MRDVRNFAWLAVCGAMLLFGCGEPVLGDFPVEPVGGSGGGSGARCFDGEVMRDLRVPESDEVRIVEWIANPLGSDTELEWIEVWFGATVDLNGLALGATLDSAKPVVAGEDCAPVDAGSLVVFGASPAAAPRVDAELPFSLPNTGSRTIVAAFEGRLLDQVDYDGAVEGVSTQIDEAGARCEAEPETPYDGSNHGTPGEENPLCPRALLDGECFDDGVARAIVSPKPGDAFLREWMPDPEAVENRDGEWVEVLFERAVDLNRLTLADLTGESTLEQEECIGVAAGESVVFAREVDPVLNGGIPVDPYPLSISLNNRDETLELRVGGQVLDSLSYARSEPGVAQQVDDDGRTCAASRPYGDGDLGTPGSPNPSCT